MGGPSYVAHHTLHFPHLQQTGFVGHAMHPAFGGYGTAGYGNTNPAFAFGHSNINGFLGKPALGGFYGHTVWNNGAAYSGSAAFNGPAASAWASIAHPGFIPPPPPPMVSTHYDPVCPPPAMYMHPMAWGY